MSDINGKEIASSVHEQLREQIASFPSKPGLAAVLIGDNPASKVYVGIKQKTCEKVGIHSELYHLPEETSEEEALALIKELNAKKEIDAILVQLPVPKHISEEKIFAEILPDKDADGFTGPNVSNLVANNEMVVPCTPKGVIELLDAINVDVAGKDAVVVGRSGIVGKPISIMLLNRSATVTICHSRTKDLKEKTKQADILIVAVGKPGIITKDMVKEGAVVIDVGINRVGDKLVGDVDYEKVKDVASWITPVPGGVGPMTVAMLLQNTVELYKRHHGL